MDPNKYIGVHKDFNGGMTNIGKHIRDAWVFGLLPEDETCENWEMGRINNLLGQVDQEWDKYGCLPSKLPEELRERHAKYHSVAINTALEQGWTGEDELGDDK